VPKVNVFTGHAFGWFFQNPWVSGHVFATGHVRLAVELIATVFSFTDPPQANNVAVPDIVKLKLPVNGPPGYEFVADPLKSKAGPGPMVMSPEGTVPVIGPIAGPELGVRVKL